MNKFTYAAILFLSISLGSFAQEKIKGDRNVTIEQTYVDNFNTLIVGNNLNVQIVYNSRTSVEVEADSNLHEVIQFEVLNGVLNLTTSQQITSSKKVLLTINYNENLQHIEARDDAEVRSLTSLELKEVSLKTSGDAKAYLNIRATNFSYNSIDKSRSRLNVVADSTNFLISDNSKIEALINSKTFNIDLYQRASVSIEGDIKNAIMRIDNSSSLNAKNLTVENCTIKVEGRSTAVVNVSKLIEIEAADNSEIYLYGNPKIEMKEFLGSAKLLKKEQ
ncbi:GIN domain-containing protein [Paucihalobacter sp.]|uniref:GIN domain-containing protein n=1 Tax=Paucihalobacter sp. TaxID=2850405 RepID=UPI002FDFED5E